MSEHTKASQRIAETLEKSPGVQRFSISLTRAEWEDLLRAQANMQNRLAAYTDGLDVVCMKTVSDNYEAVCRERDELLSALKDARDYVALALTERKAALAGYPNKWRGEQDDLDRIDALIARMEEGK